MSFGQCPWRVDRATPSWAAYWSWSFSDSDHKSQVPFLGGRLCLQIWGEGERTQAWNALREGLPGQRTRDLQRQRCRDPVLLGAREARVGPGREQTSHHRLPAVLLCSFKLFQSTGHLQAGPGLATHHAPAPPHLHLSLCAVACCKSPPMPACVLMKVACLLLWWCFTPSVVRRYLQRSFQEGVVLWGWGWGQGGGAQCASLLIPFRGCTPVPPRLLEVDVPETM